MGRESVVPAHEVPKPRVNSGLLIVAMSKIASEGEQSSGWGPAIAKPKGIAECDLQKLSDEEIARPAVAPG